MPRVGRSSEQQEGGESGKLHRSPLRKRTDDEKAIPPYPVTFLGYLLGGAKGSSMRKLMFALPHLTSPSDRCVFRLGGDGSGVYEK